VVLLIGAVKLKDMSWTDFERVMTQMMDRDTLLRKIRQRPNDMLALGRTILANERTLLSFLRTGIGLLAGGIGIVGFIDRPVIVIMGWCAIAVSIPIIIWGVWRYRVINKLLTEVAAGDFGSTE
jgi:putative membrane protein